MGMKLVIVESPAKAKTINRFLGPGFVVKSSVGHVRDLPVSALGVDIENGFQPKYVLVKGKKKVIDELKRAAKECDAVYLAPDPDREGEAIAWHLREILEDRRDPKPFLRVQYNEITPGAVRAAFERPGEIDMDRVNAQQARRVLDRIVGYQVSPMLWRRIRWGLSAGRVQSVALRLVCEREDEIRKFVPEEFWAIGARVRKLVDPRDPFRIKLLSIDGVKAHVRTAADAGRVSADLEGRALRVSDVATRPMTKRAPPPFITSTLQQAASGAFGFSPSRTMSLAQRLYEGVDLGQGPVGLITYMRTDSFTVSQQAVESCREWIHASCGDAYCPETPNVYRSRSSAQGAHEAIRPTDVGLGPERLPSGMLPPDEAKLYGLIWRRFVASQMAPATIAQRTVDVDALPPEGRGGAYRFRAISQEVVFPGYLKIAGSDLLKREGEEEEPAQTIPPVEKGESLECLEWLSERKETMPPPRYSEASLVNALERNGVGRPSTYAQIVATLQQREYVRRRKRSLEPTDLGMEVNSLLVSTLEELFNVAFTASMEKSLDEVEKGTVEWTRMLGDFYQRFHVWMDACRLPPADPAAVTRVIEALGRVTGWAEPVKRGKRTYSDPKFVASVQEQMQKGEKPVSERQLEALMRIACRYREQIPDIDAVLRQNGREDMLQQRELLPPLESTVRKLGLLEPVALDEKTAAFVASLRAQVRGGRRLSDPQVRALDNVLRRNADRIPGFDQQRAELELGADAGPAQEDKESGVLLQALAGVEKWNPPTERRGRTFDDKAFHASLSEQFGQKRFLSDRQRAALRKMVSRYRSQVKDYESVAAAYGLKSRAEGPGGGDATD